MVVPELPLDPSSVSSSSVLPLRGGLRENSPRYDREASTDVHTQPERDESDIGKAYLHLRTRRLHFNGWSMALAGVATRDEAIDPEQKEQK